MAGLSYIHFDYHKETKAGKYKLDDLVEYTLKPSRQKQVIIYVYIYIYICNYIHIYIYTYIQSYIHAYIYNAYVRICEHANIHSCIHTYILIHIHAHYNTRTLQYAYTLPRIYSNTQRYIHKNIQ